jgi:hypothetical protein
MALFLHNVITLALRSVPFGDTITTELITGMPWQPGKACKKNGDV